MCLSHCLSHGKGLIQSRDKSKEMSQILLFDLKKFKRRPFLTNLLQAWLQVKKQKWRRLARQSLGSVKHYGILVS